MLMSAGGVSEDLKAYGSAIESFTEAIDLDPKNDSAFLHRGYAHFYLGDFAMAISDLSHSIELQPNNSRAYAMRASALASSGRTNDAITDATQAIERDPRNAENYLMRANFHQQIGQPQEALKDFGQAIQLAPESAKAYLGRAAILRTHGQLPQSLTDCSKAIQLNPADSAAYVCRAQFYLATGAAQPAIEDINRAMLIGQNPAEAATLLSAAQRMIDTKPPAPAPHSLSRLVVAEARRRPRPRPSLHRPLRPVAKPPVPLSAAAPLAMPVRTVATQPVARAPGNGSPIKPPQVLPVSSNSGRHTARDANRFYRQGRYLSEQENFEQAVQAFNQAIQIDPAHALALNARGYAQLRLHNYQGAIDDCSRAIHLESELRECVSQPVRRSKERWEMLPDRETTSTAPPSSKASRKRGRNAPISDRDRQGAPYCSGRSLWPLPPLPSPSSGITVGITDAAAT